jgi:ring-1,2-phenylacetyl-CoA epoxidase subunit PaaC
MNANETENPKSKIQNPKSLETLLLSLADDEFILGVRNSEWTGVAPMLEEDVAFSSMAQDEIGHARLFYEMLAELAGGNADVIAYGRQPGEYLSCQLMERPLGDWAYSVMRQYMYDTADYVRLEALSRSSYEPLANATQKIIREEKYHLMHGDMWLSRLATRSDVSREHLLAALEDIWPDALGVWEQLPGEDDLVADGILPASFEILRSEWLGQIAPSFYNLDLLFPAEKDAKSGLFVSSVEPKYGGRRGQHTEDFTALWAEMTEVYRLDPEAVW